MTSHNISLRQIATGENVKALLHENVDPAFAKSADILWTAFIAEAKTQAVANGRVLSMLEHQNWSWETKVQDSSNLLSMPALAIECNGEAQGIMMLVTDGYWSRNSGTRNQPLVYVQYLSTAPWNLPAITLEPKYKGVGTVLLSAAIQLSLNLDFKGRIGLHSLPQAEPYYECHSFDCYGIDRHNNLKYYELSAESAAKFLK